MKCEYCGAEFTGRADARYCSEKCKQGSYRKRRTGKNLSGIIQSNKFEYKPIRQQNQFQSTLNRQVTNTVVNGISSGLSGGLGHSLSDGVATLTNPNNHPAQTLIMLSFGVVGSIIGYNTENKKNSKRLMPTVIGAGLGLLLGNIGSALYFQVSEWIRQKNEFLQINNEIQKEQLGVLRNELHSSNDVRYMQIPTLKFDGVYGQYLGTNINYGFLMLVYGGAGGGKSHFATQLASYLEKIGKVLYVLAEEGITASVQERINRYDLKNTSFVETRSEEELIQNLDGFRFVILDSINGMTNFNNHVDLVRRLKSNPNIYGTIIVNQVNKNGEFVGTNALLHEVDIEIQVENGIAEAKKNRFSTVKGNKLRIFNDKIENIVKVKYA